MSNRGSDDDGDGNDGNNHYNIFFLLIATLNFVTIENYCL